MEIFNIIWEAVSTPNENLVDILLLFFGFIETYLVMTIFLSILDIKSNKKQKLSYVLLSSIVGMIAMNFIPTPINMVINYIVMIVSAILIFRLSILKGIFSIIVAILLFALSGILITNPYLSILNISSEALNSIVIYRIPFLLIIYAVLCIAIFIIKHKDYKITFVENIDRNTKFAITITLLLGLLAIILQSTTLVYYIDILPVFITFSSFIFFLAYFSISIYTITRAFKLVSTTRKLQSAKEYNNTLKVLHDSVRCFKHDFDNILTALGGYIKTEDMEGLKQYYSQLSNDSLKVNNLYVLNPEIINNDGIYNLLAKKYHEAEEKDIIVNISFALDLSKLHMKIYEFARILGILLDNAIDASSECEEKIINIVFRDDRQGSRQILLVENTYLDKDIDIHKITEKGFTGKENHTGLGLWEVTKILKKNHNLNLHTSKNDKYFSQQLEIYYN